ncbi:plasmid mobilization relaxosome protein MobC [uncultured Alistipes sp.]|uniref:plasmid mobilization protein n=1 Tax=Alistipes muris TaxID=2941326 RepID=UPI0025A5273C|nr:plasmid mobilization relaxosome protein MobC [uncultured Alistipes sp.]
MKQIPIHKGGRPAISEGRRKKYQLSLRLDAEHYFKLKSLVRTSGHGTAEVLRQLIAAGRVRERLRREHLDFMSQLKGMARNLNQLTRLAHAKGLTGIVSRHTAIVVSIESLLKNLRDDR